jgi:hypothetical protein
MKYFLYLLIPALALTAASAIRLSQLRDKPMTSPTLLMMDTNGNAFRGSVAGLTVDANNNVTLPVAPAAVPVISVTKVTAAGMNAFPIPSGKSICFVSRNIPQAPGEDYTVSGSIISFTSPTDIGDIVTLLCF